MANVTAVTDADFDSLVRKSEVPVLIDFWATWCRPCQALSPVLEELANEYGPRLKFLKMDMDANRQTIQMYHVMSAPTLLIFKKGQPVATIVGNKPKDALRREIDGALG